MATILLMQLCLERTIGTALRWRVFNDLDDNAQLVGNPVVLLVGFLEQLVNRRKPRS